MPYEFRGIDFKIGGQAGSDELMWGSLTIDLKDTDADHNPSVELTLLLKRHPDLSIAAIEAEARETAKRILEKALDVLANSELSQLRTEARRRRVEGIF